MGIERLLGVIGIILISVFLLVAARNYFSNGNINTNAVKDIKVNDEEQVVALGIKNYNYYPNTINLKYNVPAKIVVDTKTVNGCFRGIVIPEFGIRKLITERDNVISFTPNKKGSFRFSCSMGMGYGKIIVN